MPRFTWRSILLTGGILFVPAAVLAATFQGPSNGCTPPNCNVPGVIWNSQGGAQQTGAQINIDGRANFGSSTDKNTFLGDNILENGKAFRVDQSGSANYFMGNWYGGISRALSFYVNGDVYADRVSPYVGTGNEGRVQARKFCFYPGTPADCISSWTGMGGLYVQKAGDSMTGTLDIQTSYPTGLNAYSSNGSGVVTDGSFSGLVASGTAYAALFYGGTGGSVISYAQKQYTASVLGIGSGPHTTGGSFQGTEYGVYASGTLYGLYAKGGVAGYFQGTNGGVYSVSNNQGSVFSAYGNLQGTRGISVYATSSNAIAGEFSGGVTGVSSTAVGTGGIFNGTTGVLGSGSTYGVSGVSEPSSGAGVRGDNGYYGGYGMLGYANYGVYGNGSWWGGSFYGTTAGVRGADNDTSIYGILGYNTYSLYGNGDVYTSGDANFGGTLNATGDITAAANTLSSCAWTGYVSDGSALTCPSSNPILNGVQRSGTTMRAYCCDL